MTDKIRYCRKCKKISDYPSRNICRNCQSQEVKDNILDRFGTYRNYNLFRNYGILQEDYDRMYEEQKGLCFICGRERTLVVDHNHKTGKIRKLLCSGCNSGIGRFEYNPSLFDKAKAYILNE